MAAPLTRDEAERVINHELYGLTPEWLEQLFERFGTAALTDEAVIWLGQQQYAREMSR